MRAFVIRGPGDAGVEDVPAPDSSPGEVVVDVARAGICGTDVEFFTGHMSYLHDGQASFPMRIGHEWVGMVAAVGRGVDSAWLGRRVTGDTMLGCGTCDRCRSGRQHVCARRTELGIRGGRPGALAEQVAVPASALRALPDSVDDTMGTLVEPGANALRAARAASVRRGERALVMGAGTIGLLAAMFLRADGVEVHLLGRSPRSLYFARSIGFANAWTDATLPALTWDVVIDASNATEVPARALELAEPGKRGVYIGLAPEPSLVDSRTIALKDLTVVGILSGSPGLDGAVEAYASGAVDPRPLVGATIGLGGLVDVLAGNRPADAGGPKIHVAIRA
jgi:threonine dehydrogenase-like Zn-dependent dehydrogenase